MAADLRSETFPFGIAGRGLSDVTRQIPADEPPALAPNAELQVIGRPVPRQNGRAKVTGATRFTVDLKLPGMLHGRILRSTWPHARIRSVDVSAAQELPGVRSAIVLARPDDTASSIVRYVGAPVAAVAAISMAVAEEALRLIRVDAEPLPFVVDLEQALLATAPVVFDSASAPQGYASGFPAAHGLPLAGNLRGPAIESRGDIAQGFAQADVTVDAEYRTEVQTHCCLEPHATVADWRADGLTVYQSTQFTAGVRQELANAFGLPLAKVRVVVDGMGGGFGSKSQLGNYGRIAVMLSRQAGTPVRVALDRREEQTDAGNRPGTWQQLRIGARRDGTLTAISLRSRGTAGVAVGAGVGNNAQAMYECPNFDGAQYDVFTNAGPGCAMRGPGNTPGAWGLEQAIDELAEKLGMDPLVLRDRIDASPVRREERRLGAERIGWARRRAWGTQPTDTGAVRRGIGMAQSIWSTNVQTNSSCEVRLHRDGTVEVLSSVQDIGTVLAQVVAEVFGLRAQEIHVRIGDTEFPAGPPSYGSRTTASITPPARTAAWRVLQALLAVAAPALQARPEDLVACDGRVVVRDEPTRGMPFRDAAGLLHTDRIGEIASRSDDYAGFRRRIGSDAALALQDLGGVQFAEVAVDTETGIVRVERVVAVHDCGRPMNPKLIESQVQGGVLMGLSYALFEQRVLDRHTGRMVNANLEQYKLAGPSETPAIDVILLENYQGHSATDAYGIAEPANIATAPAIANAVCNAIGVRMRSLPMSPATVLAGLRDASTGGRPA